MESTALGAHAAGALTPSRARLLRGVAVAAALFTLAGAALAPARLWPGLLLAGLYVLGLGLGGLLFLVFAHATRGEWSRPLRPVPAALTATLPLGAALVALAFAGLPWLYDWCAHPLAGGKGAWLSPGPFLARGAVCLLAWTVWGRWIARLPFGRSAVRASCAFLPVFAITFSIASFDWIMSLEAHWFSTVFATYVFSGVFVSGLAAITTIAIALRRSGRLAGVIRDDHLHDLGKLLLGFTTFWAYIWFCQHMLIWYADIPEETAYFVPRLSGAWGPLMVLCLVVNWLIPFLVLLPRASKRRESTMLGISILLLFGHALDLYLLILPPSLEGGPGLGPWEVAPFAGSLAVFLLVLGRALRAPGSRRTAHGRP